MRDKKFRKASAHASGEVSASAFPVGHLPASRLRLRDIFLIARPPLLRHAGGASTLQPYVFRYFGQLCLESGSLRSERWYQYECYVPPVDPTCLNGFSCSVQDSLMKCMESSTIHAHSTDTLQTQQGSAGFRNPDRRDTCTSAANPSIGPHHSAGGPECVAELSLSDGIPGTDRSGVSRNTTGANGIPAED